MNKTLKSALRRSRTNSEYYTAKQGSPTPDIHYITEIKPHKVICNIEFPPNVRLNLTEAEVEVLDKKIHSALESIFARYF